MRGHMRQASRRAPCGGNASRGRPRRNAFDPVRRPPTLRIRADAIRPGTSRSSAAPPCRYAVGRGLHVRTTIQALLLMLAIRVPSVQAPADDKTAVQQANDQFVKDWTKRIAGRESEPAGQVFENIRLDWFKRTPAGTLLEIMDGGYAKALGVRCTHCHDEHDFASDEKRAKRAAREMAAMHWEINQQLARMQNLKSPEDERAINCATCHRGAVDPHEPQP